MAQHVLCRAGSTAGAASQALAAGDGAGATQQQASHTAALPNNSAASLHYVRATSHSTTVHPHAYPPQGHMCCVPHAGKVPACLKEQVVSVNGTYLAYADQPEGPQFGWCDSTPPTCERPQCGVTVPRFWTAMVGGSRSSGGCSSTAGACSRGQHAGGSGDAHHKQLLHRRLCCPGIY